MYDIRTAILPFLFIFNTELLLIDVTPLKAVAVFLVSTIAMLAFAAATQQYFLVRNRIWESLVLLLVAFSLFRPGFWLDQISPPFDIRAGSEIVTVAGAEPVDADLKIEVSGPSFDDTDKIISTTLIVPLGAAADGEARLNTAGLTIMLEDDKALLEEPFPGTPFEALGRNYDFYADTPVTVSEVFVPNERMPKEVFFIPAFALLAGIFFLQRGRKRAQESAA